MMMKYSRSSKAARAFAAATSICALAVGLALTSGFAQAQVEGLTKAVCVLKAAGGSGVTGTVTFTQTDEGILIEAHVMGLSPGKHGFHIHEFGDVSADDGTSTGGHFNPDGVDHAGPDSESRHVGDLGNLEANDGGHAMYNRVDTHIQLHGVKAILSRGIVIHAGEDDLTSQPTGAAGARVAVGVIGIAKPE